MKLNKLFIIGITMCFSAIFISSSNASNNNDFVKIQLHPDWKINILHGDGITEFYKLPKKGSLELKNIIFNDDETTTEIYGFPEDFLWLKQEISNKYFTIGNIKGMADSIIINDFECKKHGNYDLYIEDYTTSQPGVVLNYQNNPLYIPNIHLKDIRKLNINSNLKSIPRRGQIDDINDNIVFLNNELLKNYNNIKVEFHISTILKITCKCIRTIANELYRSGKELVNAIVD